MQRADQAEAAGNPAKAEAYLRAAGNYTVAKGVAGTAGELFVDGRSLPRMFANPPEFRWHAGHSMYGDNSAGMASMSPQPSRTQSEIDAGLERTVIFTAAVPATVASFAFSAPVSAGYFTIGAITSGSLNFGFKLHKYDYELSKFERKDLVDLVFATGTGGLTFGKNITPSLPVNMTGAYHNAVINGDSSGAKVATSAIGTVFGGYAGTFAQSIVPLTSTGNFIAESGSLIFNVVTGGTVNEAVGIYSDEMQSPNPFIPKKMMRKTDGN